MPILETGSVSERAVRIARYGIKGKSSLDYAANLVRCYHESSGSLRRDRIRRIENISSNDFVESCGARREDVRTDAVEGNLHRYHVWPRNEFRPNSPPR